MFGTIFSFEVIHCIFGAESCRLRTISIFTEFWIYIEISVLFIISYYLHFQLVVIDFM